MEKVITIEDVTYTMRTRTAGEGKILRNKLDVDGFKKGGAVPLGDFEIATIWPSLKTWSREEPLTQPTFEKLTPDTHVEILFDVAKEINTFTTAEKKTLNEQFVSS